MVQQPLQSLCHGGRVGATCEHGDAPRQAEGALEAMALRLRARRAADAARRARRAEGRVVAHLRGPRWARPSQVVLLRASVAASEGCSERTSTSRLRVADAP